MTQEESKAWIALMEKFMPKEVAIDNHKHMAMYELYHRMKKEFAATQRAAAPLPAGEAWREYIKQFPKLKEFWDSVPEATNTWLSQQIDIFAGKYPPSQSAAAPKSDAVDECGHHTNWKFCPGCAMDWDGDDFGCWNCGFVKVAAKEGATGDSSTAAERK